MSEEPTPDDAEERRQAPGHSGEPPVPDAESKPGSGEPGRAGEEVAGGGAGTGAGVGDRRLAGAAPRLLALLVGAHRSIPPRIGSSIARLAIRSAT